LPAELKKFYSDFETDVFANRRLVDYNFRQDDGTLESVPIYIPAKDFSDFFIAHEYKSGAERPTFNHWTGQGWAFDESVWRRWQTGNGPLIDCGSDVPARALKQVEPTRAKSLSTSARSNRKLVGFLALMYPSILQQHDVSFAAAPGSDHEHSVQFFAMLAVAFLLVPALLWCFGAPFVVQVFAVYVSLYMAWSMLTYAARDASHNSAILVLNALLLKLVFSLGLWRAFDGSSFTELSAAVWKERDIIYQYACPSALYALGDVLRVVALRLTSPGTFAVIFNTRVLFLCFVWQYWMGRRLKAVHWLSLVLILVGSYAKEAHSLDFGNHQADSTRYYGYQAVLILGVCTATAAVLNEGLLQHRSEVSVSLQNLAMYGWGVMWTALISVIWMLVEPDNTTSSLFHSDAWLAVWAHPLVLGQAVVLALYGVTTAYFLRYLNNIAREVAIGIFAILSVAMDYLVFGATLHLLEIVGAFLLICGIGLFAWCPVTAPKQAAGLGSAGQAVGKDCGSIESREHSEQSERSTSEGGTSGLEDLESESHGK
jgi:drug/metabolite transporter (DMT)-like permease